MCQRRAGAAAVLTPGAVACGVGVIVTVLIAIVAVSWCTGEGRIGQWSVVQAPPTGHDNSAEDLLVAAAGGDRLSQEEALAVMTIAVITEMEMGPRPVATGFVTDRHVAIMTACEALQAGDARRAVWALEMFADGYDAIGTPLRAVARYVADEDADQVSVSLLEAQAAALNAKAMSRALDRAAVWFAGRALVERGARGAARTLWSRLERPPDTADTFSRMADIAVRDLESK